MASVKKPIGDGSKKNPKKLKVIIANARKSASKKKVNGAIIQNKQTKNEYNLMRNVYMDLPKLSKSQKTATAKEYKSTTAALKSKKTPSVARENIQLQRARTAGILSVDNARKTRKVSGPKSKRGN